LCDNISICFQQAYSKKEDDFPHEKPKSFRLAQSSCWLCQLRRGCGHIRELDCAVLALRAGLTLQRVRIRGFWAKPFSSFKVDGTK